MSLRDRKQYNIMTAKGATGIGTVIPVGDFRNAVVTIATASNANLTVKAQGSIGDTPPAFGSAQSATNMWDYVQMIDLNDGNPTNGDTGFVVTGTDDFKQYEININSLDYLTFNVTARSAGTVTINIVLTDNL